MRTLRAFVALTAVALLPRRLSRPAVETLATHTIADIALEAVAFTVALFMRPWCRDILAVEAAPARATDAALARLA